jgi:hypothetical protein
VLRVDRVAEVAVLADTSTPPAGLNPLETREEHLAQGWKYEVEVVVDAPAGLVAEWLPRSLGRPEPLDAHTTRLLATTGEPGWYAEQLLTLRAPFRIVKPRELREAARTLGQLFLDASRSFD